MLHTGPLKVHRSVATGQLKGKAVDYLVSGAFEVSYVSFQSVFLQCEVILNKTKFFFSILDAKLH